MNWLINGLGSWKTTLAAIVGALSLLLNQLGIVHITSDQQTAFLTVLLFVIGFFAKDASVRGRTSDGDE